MNPPPRSVVKKNRVQKISNEKAKKVAQSNSFSGRISEAIMNFRPELDLRGMRGEVALQELENYMDKAIMLGFPSIKIIHGKGDGILRKLIRTHLKGYKQVDRMEDEHLDRGGDGITYRHRSAGPYQSAIFVRFNQLVSHWRPHGRVTNSPRDGQWLVDAGRF